MMQSDRTMPQAIAASRCDHQNDDRRAGTQTLASVSSRNETDGVEKKRMVVSVSFWIASQVQLVVAGMCRN
jgi:hypothetical protein